MTPSTPSPLAEIEADLAGRVAAAARDRTPLRLCGGGSQAALCRSDSGAPLDLTVLQGIIAYEPSELVITVGAGTPLTVVADALAARGQMLPFEPRLAEGRATVGGAVAAQRGGPRRWTAGAVRDFLLGLVLIDGRGQRLRFGGQVIKNVAGFDVTRLQAGAWGSLGIITEVSIKVLPLPLLERTLQFELDQAQALHQINAWAGQPLPLSASSWEHGCLRVRLSGVAAAVDLASRVMGGEALDDRTAAAHWAGLRERCHPFFSAGGTLWRLALRPTAAVLELPGSVLWEWGGGQRWLRSDAPVEQVRRAAAAAGGHAELHAGGPAGTPVFHPLAAPLDGLHRRIKAVFDPAGILNPGTPDYL
ncbi:MAG: glycolate oxidase subunit GlcE [Pseudomonadota bacterium]|nr:glycolate oxidase subunit GlcE [Pseudomonadota bacterium]